MQSAIIEKKLFDLFGADFLRAHVEEWAFLPPAAGRDICRIGWAASLTPDIAQQAVNAKADLLVTHHDAWSFLYEMREESRRHLHCAGIGHLFVHGPLDQAEFGTAATVLDSLGCRSSKPFEEGNGIFWGRTGTLPEPANLGQVELKLNDFFDETPRFRQLSGRLASQVAVITGGGCSTEDLRAALAEGCDTYITGEYNCYFGLYAQHVGLNVLVYSHTYTERKAVPRLVERLLRDDREVEIVELSEGHL